MPDEAFMRVNGLDETPLTVERGGQAEGGPIIINVPGFGYLVVGEHPDEGPLAMLYPFNPPAHPPVGSSRPVIVREGRLEVPMLHKAGRLDVVIQPAPIHQGDADGR